MIVKGALVNNLPLKLVWVISVWISAEKSQASQNHDDVIKWKHFPRYWPFVWGIHWSPVNSPHKGQWRGVLMFTLICARINGWVNNREAGDLRRHGAHYDIIIMLWTALTPSMQWFPSDIYHHCIRHWLDIIQCFIITWCQWYQTVLYLTHCGLVMPYGDIDLGQLYFW